jgi:tetratricopeptide (TPR) repeat protein
MLLGLADQMVRYPRPTRALAGVVERLQLDGTSRQLLSGLSGRDTLGKALAPVLSSSQALAAVWVLDAARLLNYSEQSVRDATNMDMEEDLDTEIEISILGSEPNEAERPAPDSDRAPTAPPRRDAGPGDRDASPPASAEVQALREEVLGHLKQLDDLNYYGLLDVTPDAATGAIRKAYFSAAKRYHPDALARLGLNDIKEEAARVFARMAEANETLSDKNKRAEYDASLETDEPAIDATRLAQAETFFRKGEILTNMGDFKGALEYLRPAVELWPDEATYQSTLAWAYYKKRPAEPDKALVHLRKALALDPDDSVSQFRLGLVERALAS